MTPRQLALQLITAFGTAYKQKHAAPIAINRNTAKWAAMDIIDSFGYAECMRALEYYFAVADRHSWQYYVNNCGAFLEKADAIAKDKADRRIAQERAKRWLNE